MPDFLNCNWDTARFLIFSDNVYDPLIYYSHLLPLISSIILGLFVFLSNKKLLINRLFFILTLLFSTWIYFDLILWATGDIEHEMFFWKILLPVEFLIFVTTFFLTKKFISDVKVSKIYKTLFSLLFLPILLLTYSNYNLTAFDYTNCDRGAFEGPLWTYLYIIEGVIFLIILGEIIYALFKDKDRTHRIKSAIFSLGIVTFLGLFIIGNVTLIQDLGWGYEQYKLFGMIGFLVVLVFLIVRFKTFDIKLIGSQALVWTLIIVIGSQFFFIQNNTNRVLTAITLVISAITGLMIVRGMKKEIAQREKIEQLAQNLKELNGKLESSNLSLGVANEKLKELDSMKSEFVSLATHQIRGPLAAIKGYISLMLEGDYGKVTKALAEPLKTVFKSTDSLSRMVTDFLDVSRIDLGQMKYDFTDFDLRDLVNEVITELKPGIEEKKLELRIKIPDEKCLITADHTKLKQVLNNLVDNSNKYTKQGWLEVSLERKKEGNVLFAVKDSGVGINAKTITKLFQRFSRAKDANDTNILGTGLGLYIAKKMVEAHNGKVWAESAGEGKGAQFYVELKLKE